LGEAIIGETVFYVFSMEKIFLKSSDEETLPRKAEIYMKAF
jgi:hypothetical protein